MAPDTRPDIPITSASPARFEVATGMELFPARGELTYFDRSRRQFLKLSGLTLAGLLLPESLWHHDALAALSPARVDQAVAWAFQDAGVKVVTHVPATGATAIFDAYHGLLNTSPCYAFNEEVAFTMSHGAALAGARSATVIKAHGLAKAANSVIDAVTLGTTAGQVTLVLDDPSGNHSDNIFGLEEFLKGTGIPFKKAEQNSVYQDVHESICWSEELRTPVVLVIDSELVSRETTCVRRNLPPTTVKYQRDPLRHLLCPPLAPYQNKVQKARMARTDWRAIPAPALPVIPGGLPPAWRTEAARFVPLFEVFQEFRSRIPFVAGDTGLSSLFAFAPFSCIDACSYYGGSLPLALGFHLAGHGRAWAVTGDYTFVAAGHLGLIEALARQAPLKVLVVDNGCAMATGGQPLPSRVFEQVVSGWTPYVTRIDTPWDKSVVRSVLNNAIQSDRLEIVVASFCRRQDI